MLRATILAFVTATTLGATAASAQQVIVPGGPSIDFRSEGQRERDFRREERRRDRAMERRAEEREFRRDRMDRRGGGCRTITVRERDDFGRTVTRTREEC